MAAALTDLFAKASNGVAPVPTTLSAQKLTGAASATITLATGWPTDTAIHFILYQVDANNAMVAGTETLWKGILTGTTINSLTLRSGTDTTYAAGSVVQMAPTSAWADDFVTGMIAEHNQLGIHQKINGNTVPVGTDTVTLNGVSQTLALKTLTSPVITSPTVTGNYSGWMTGQATPNTVTYNGNRSYSVVFNSTDLTSYISNGMRLKLTRTVNAPTQCTSLNGTTQYYSKAAPAGMTFTDDFTVSAWVKLTAYGTNMVASRYDGTSGWYLYINSSGQVTLTGNNGGAGNTSQVQSYQSIPLNKWVHIQANLDMSAFSTNTDGSATGSCIAIDGVGVPSNVSRAGTNPTALIQSGNLNIGSWQGGLSNFFSGKIAQVAIFNSKITVATMQGYISQGLAGTETSLISAYSFNNSINDLNANANNLTANGSALATNTDSPFTQDDTGTPLGTTDFGIVTSKVFSTNTTLTIQVPEGCAIPTSGGVSAVSYSTQRAPYGFPAQRIRWAVEMQAKARQSSTTASTATVLNLGHQLIIPVGAWEVSYSCLTIASTSVAAGFIGAIVGLSTANNTFSDSQFVTVPARIGVAVTEVDNEATKSSIPLSLSSATTYFLNIAAAAISGTTTLFIGDSAALTLEPTVIRAYLSYL